MATIAKNLYVLPGTGLLNNPTGPTYGDDSLPPLTSGDTLQLSLYYFAPFDNSIHQCPLVRKAGSSTTVRLRANVNNIIYATGTSYSEITPAAASITQSQAGSNYYIEKQAVIINGQTGTFKLSFYTPQGAVASAGEDGWYIMGTTNPIPAGASAADIQSAINALQFWKIGSSRPGPYTADQAGSRATVTISNWTQYTGFTINYGFIRNYVNTCAYPYRLAQLDDSAIGYPWGWNITVPLNGNGNPYADLFNPANGPSYFEVVLTEAGVTPSVVASRLVSAAGSSGTPPPTPPTPGGGNPGLGAGSVGAVFYDGNWSDATAVEDARIVAGIATDNFSLIYKQKYQQARANWQPLALGAYNCPYNQYALSVQETELQDLGGGICEWERVWALKPNARKEPGSAIKTYKFLQYIKNNGVIDPASYAINSRSATIKCDFFYNYFNIFTDNVTVPEVPDVSLIRNPPFYWVVNYGGFNGNNHDYCLISVDIRPYMGPLIERLMIYG